MRRIYLDQWAWIELAKAAAGKQVDQNFVDLLEVARHGVARGLLSFPLSVVHYMELHHTSNARQRWNVGRLMQELSRNHRLVSATDAVIAAEFDAALNRCFGVPEIIREVQIFGLGASHAFGRPLGELQLVPLDEEHSQVIDPVLRLQLETYANEQMELALLCGPGEGQNVPGYNPRSHLAFAEGFVVAEEDQAEKFRAFHVRSDNQQRVLNAREWIHLNEGVATDALVRAGIEPKRFFALGADFLSDFLADLPVVHAQVEMLRLQHQAPQRRWTTNDYFDVIGLSMAVVHCDAVVTEKYWNHLLVDRLGLNQKFGTTIVSNRTLPNLLTEILK